MMNHARVAQAMLAVGFDQAEGSCERILCNVCLLSLRFVGKCSPFL